MSTPAPATVTIPPLRIRRREAPRVARVPALEAPSRLLPVWRGLGLPMVRFAVSLAVEVRWTTDGVTREGRVTATYDAYGEDYADVVWTRHCGAVLTESVPARLLEVVQ